MCDLLGLASFKGAINAVIADCLLRFTLAHKRGVLAFFYVLMLLQRISLESQACLGVYHTYTGYSGDRYRKPPKIQLSRGKYVAKT